MTKFICVLVLGIMIGFLSACASGPPKATSTDLDLRERRTNKFNWGATQRKNRNFEN
jgi:hypothetical protein